MTDYPRFQPVQSEPVDGGYHGADGRERKHAS